MQPTGLYRTYAAATALALPFAARARVKKLRRAGISAHRAHEVLGHATERRPGGTLIWFHAASVGESLSVLSLITAMGRALPLARFLITSGTPTSATLIAKRMPPRCQHQFVPLDGPGPLKRFLRAWRPDAFVLVESELWPNMLVHIRKAGVPMALVNARLSERSLKRWAKRPKTARFLLEGFSLVFAQTNALADQLIALGTQPDKTRKGVDLKSLSAPLPVHGKSLSDVQHALGPRPVWAACSTHPGEEQEVLTAHISLLETQPDLCLILAPRHPERGLEVAKLVTDLGLSLSRRSTGDIPQAQVYLADTLGELGLWYTLAPFVFLGGSLKPIGGHNPYEPAHMGAAVLSGVHVNNFADTYAKLEAAGGARLVSSGANLAQLAQDWFEHPVALTQARQAARDFAGGQADTLDSIANALIDGLDLNV
ncbi:3-deoxy-D-manno-octulosonic acid transferase [Ascidiaceihabitans sp.]|uniref:3-deoxy-D-manno-octulosonic acid transferase n=1 Tax=Ascidiaceihabitans sp. TaxID=1872644 RepID=UPI00329A6D7D